MPFLAGADADQVGINRIEPAKKVKCSAAQTFFLTS